MLCLHRHLSKLRATRGMVCNLENLSHDMSSLLSFFELPPVPTSPGARRHLRWAPGMRATAMASGKSEATTSP